mmetsp:Transcript_363/g.813  ORF Transcript_363/g.813 Transcript_363/m.813 type:complete len:120 (-) Transcript_363:1824-2183(-)
MQKIQCRKCPPVHEQTVAVGGDGQRKTRREETYICEHLPEHLLKSKQPGEGGGTVCALVGFGCRFREVLRLPICGDRLAMEPPAPPPVPIERSERRSSSMEALLCCLEAGKELTSRRTL